MCFTHPAALCRGEFGFRAHVYARGCHQVRRVVGHEPKTARVGGGQKEVVTVFEEVKGSQGQNGHRIASEGKKGG